MKTSIALTVVALGACLAACDRNDPARTSSTTPPAVPPVTASAPPAPPDTSTATTPPADRPVAATPGTHAGAPQPEAPSTATARDTTANSPQGDLTKAEESTAMPKAGQVNNYNSPAYEPKNSPGVNK